jgi:hypothetical protein
MGDVVSIAHYVNDVKIEQRVKDGFVNATAMCIAHAKEVKFWLRTLDTFELFVALYQDLGYVLKGENNHLSYSLNLSATKYAELFPELLVVKKGSPEFGGGTWIHPDLAIQLAQWCNKTFAIQVSRWVREWLVKGFHEQNKTLTQLEKEYELYLQRHDLRVTLKDTLRVELMEAVVKYAQRNKINPYDLCWKVHDTMNLAIQGHRSKELKSLGSLPIGDLLRDYFDVNSLVMYSAINKLATNSIIDKGEHPIDAVKNACRSYLGSTYDPKPYQLTENVYAQGQRIRKSIKKAKVIQFNLFGGQDAV